MPTSTEPLRRLGFLTIGLFDGADPGPGHESTLQILERGEDLGFDSAWVRQRHLQYGISSPVALLAAATQRTSRIELGTAVIPLGWENPLRLAEDLATVDVLSGGRLNPGVSVGPPMRWDDVREALYPDTADVEDFSYERVERLLRCVRGEPVTVFSGTSGIEVFSDRVQPHSPGLASRLWYGGASLRSASWTGEHGMNLLTSSVVKAESTGSPDAGHDFAALQRAQIEAFRAAHPDGAQARVSQGLVVIPTDRATPEQRRRYQAYAESAAAPDHQPAGAGPAAVRPGPGRHVGGDGRAAARPRGVPATSTRWPSPCPSASSTPTTCRSSPTWRSGSDPRSAGLRRPTHWRESAQFFDSGRQSPVKLRRLTLGRVRGPRSTSTRRRTRWDAARPTSHRLDRAHPSPAYDGRHRVVVILDVRRRGRHPHRGVHVSSMP